MSWDSYITSMKKEFVEDAAIVGCEAGKESVWAASGTLSSITPAEIKTLVGTDRSCMFSSGVSIGGAKCTVLRDSLSNDTEHSMDIRTKGTDADSNTYSICVSKSKTALVIVKAKKDVHGGKVNEEAYKMAEYLKSVNM